MRLNYKYVILNWTESDGHPIEKLSENEWKLYWEGEWHNVVERDGEYERVRKPEDF